MNKTEMAMKLAKKTGVSQGKAAEIIDVIFSAHPRKGLIATALLALAEFVEVLADRAVALIAECIVHCPLEHRSIFQKHAHRQHGLNHRGVPITVCRGVEVLDDP